MKNCESCEHQPATVGMFCPLCNAALAVMPYILKRWERQEMGNLLSWLRRASTVDLQKEAKVNDAKLMLGLSTRLLRASTGEIHADTVKVKVCEFLNQEISAVASIEKYEGRNGEGSWNRAAAKAVGEWVSAISAATPLKAR